MTWDSPVAVYRSERAQPPLPVLYQQRAASTEDRIKKPQFRHHFSLKFSPKTEPFHSQELPKITTHVTRIPIPDCTRLYASQIVIKKSQIPLFPSPLFSVFDRQPPHDDFPIRPSPSRFTLRSLPFRLAPMSNFFFRYHTHNLAAEASREAQDATQKAQDSATQVEFMKRDIERLLMLNEALWLLLQRAVNEG